MHNTHNFIKASCFKGKDHLTSIFLLSNHFVNVTQKICIIATVAFSLCVLSFIQQLLIAFTTSMDSLFSTFFLHRATILHVIAYYTTLRLFKSNKEIVRQANHGLSCTNTLHSALTLHNISL